MKSKRVAVRIANLFFMILNNNYLGIKALIQAEII